MGRDRHAYWLVRCQHYVNNGRWRNSCVDNSIISLFSCSKHPTEENSLSIFILLSLLYRVLYKALERIQIVIFLGGGEEKGRETGKETAEDIATEEISSGYPLLLSLILCVLHGLFSPLKMVNQHVLVIHIYQYLCSCLCQIMMTLSWTTCSSMPLK